MADSRKARRPPSRKRAHPTRAVAAIRRELAEALERERATREILRVISSSPTDLQAVFDAIVESAVRLCDGVFCAVYRYDGERLHLVAHRNIPFDALELIRRRIARCLIEAVWSAGPFWTAR